MSFPNSLLSQSTWRHVGLGLTGTVFALGTLALVAPATAGRSLGVFPTTPEGHAINEKSMVFLGIRDVAVASTLFWFCSEGKLKEMGVLLSSWVLVCVTDTWVAKASLGAWSKAIFPLYLGAALTGFVGLALFQTQ